jgi:2,4-dienoyl-CoA reductase-like NADH-dependent reductase (Old Yellow Enzyme family)
MSMRARLFEPLAFHSGKVMPNRFMLAPLTNSQSHEDGTCSDEERHWLMMRARGGFGLTMTAAAHVQAVGRGFPGQIGAFSDALLPGLTRLADELRSTGSLSMVQLHHAGNRAPKDLIGTDPVCPSPDPETGARGLDLGEVERLRDDFIAAAVRADKAGFDGVEIHGAHGYIICAFLSPELNRREDRYGGDPNGRARIVHEIIAGIRAQCRKDFVLGLRLSPERFGLRLAEVRALAQEVMRGGAIDFLDMSLWDVAKAPNEPEFAHRPLIQWFTDLERGPVRLGVAGKIMTAEDCERTMAAGVDFLLIGRAAILHHDYPRRVEADPGFQPIARPVSPTYLAGEGLSPVFVHYMRNWKGFVTEA